MSHKSSNRVTPSSDETKTEQKRPQTLGEEDSLLHKNFQESSNSSGGLCHLKWATCFESLMQDRDGLEHFKKFLARTDQAGLADFYIACNGLKMIYAKCDNVLGLAKSFYKKFIKGDKLNISRPIKKTIVRAMKSESVSENIYDEAQEEIERLLRETYYPQFLESDIYANFAELENARLGSQSESPERWKQSMSTATQAESTKSVKENINMTDMSFSISSMSFMTTDDENRSRMEPQRLRNNISLIPIVEPKHSRHAPMAALGNQSVDTTDHEDNIKNITMATGSIIESSSFTSDAVNTDGMSFTSSSRDDKDIARAKGFVSSKRYNMNIKDASAQRTFLGNLSEHSPLMFFKIVERRLLDHLNGVEIAVAKERQNKTMALSSTTQNNSAAPANQHRNHNHRSLHPNDHDHLIALDTSITRIDTHHYRCDGHNITMPTNMGDYQKKQEQIIQPQHYHHHYLAAAPFRQPYPTQCAGPYSQRQVPYGLTTSHQQQLQHHLSFNNRSQVEPSLNQTFNNNSSRCMPPRNYPYDGQGQPRSSQFVHPSTVQHGYPGQHPRMMNHNTRPTITPPQVLSDFTNEKVHAWRRSTDLYGRFVGSGDHSENSLKKSTYTGHTERTQKASSSRQSKQSRNNESHHINQSSQQQDQSTGLVLNSTSTSTSNSANTIIATSHVTSDVTRMTPATTSNMNSSVANATNPSVTMVKYYLDNDAIPFKTRICGRNITFGHFKQEFSKKGKFRFFFKTLSPDFDDDEIIQEELFDDHEVVPLWQGMIVCRVNSVTNGDDEPS